MPPTRLKCLQTGVKLAPTLRATFSTTRIVRAGEPNINSSADLLAALDESKPITPSGINTTPSPAYNRISSLVPNRRSTATPKVQGLHGRLANLIGMSKSMKERADNRMDSQDTARKDLSTAERLEEKDLSESLAKQIKRRWKAGDVYAPHDLSWQEQKKWAKKSQVTTDVFDAINFNPLEHYRNLNVMSEYMTPMGRIMHRRETGLRPSNQRKIAKAIRRSIGMGLMPSVHKHPELLQKQAAKSLSMSRAGVSLMGWSG